MVEEIGTTGQVTEADANILTSLSRKALAAVLEVYGFRRRFHWPMDVQL